MLEKFRVVKLFKIGYNKELKGKLMASKQNSIWFKYSVWFYRSILLLILIFILNIGEIIIFFDTLYNPPGRVPNDRDLRISSKEDRPFLEATLHKIFPAGTDNLSKEDQAIGVLRFVAIEIKNINNLGTATKIIQDGYAVCGGKAIVFQTLFQRSGIPARQIEIFNTSDSGHTLVEAYYDGNWHLFDSSYGVFVYSQPNYDNKGNIINMYEISKDRNMGHLQGVTDTPWTGQYSAESKSYGVKPLAIDNPTLDDLWRKEIKPAYPIIYGQKNLYKYFHLLKTFNTTDLKLKLSQIF